MADFRKLFLALAVIAVFSVSAFAQVPINFSCVGNPTTNNQLRGGGITELVGDVLLTCGGGAIGINTVSFAVQVQGGATGITNRLGTLVPGLGYPISAGLVVADISGNTLQLVRGYLQAAASNIVVFPNVILPTGTTGTTVRISNIRVATNPVTSTATAIPVYATVSTTPASFPITNPLEQVATVYPALTFGVTSCSGGTAPSLTFRQCISEPSDSTAITFGLKFQEQIVASAFKNTTEESGKTFANSPGTFNFSGAAPGAITPGAIINGWSDTADHGTRLIVAFSNVPAGVTINVTNSEIALSTTSTGLNKPHALLVQGASLAGTGGSTTITSTVGAAHCGSTAPGAQDSTGTALAFVPAETSGSTVYAVWEVITDDPVNIDQFVFGVQVHYNADPGAGVPALSTAAGAVTGQFAPISAVTIASATADIPRFVSDPNASGPIFSIVPCVTNLLYTYVTNQQGFNTGVSISNTSKDNAMTGSATAEPFDTSSQTGTCTLYFFGDNAVDPYTTPTVDPGTVWQDHMGNLAPGFQGYIIARCNFQFAHGLAFIITGGGSPSAYLALVIPDIGTGSARTPDPFSALGPGKGEQLAF